MSPDEAAIRTIIDARARAIHDKDADATLASCTPEIVVFDLAPPLAVVGEEALDPTALKAWFDTWDGPIGHTFQNLQVRVADDLALAHGFLRIFGTKVGGASTAVWTRITFGFEKTDGGWAISHEHISTPFYMDGSDRAALDLEP